MASRIELWPIERLVPYERNARTHSSRQIRQIANSIAEFGFTNPILVDTKDGIIAVGPLGEKPQRSGIPISPPADG